MAGNSMFQIQASAAGLHQRDTRSCRALYLIVSLQQEALSVGTLLEHGETLKPRHTYRGQIMIFETITYY